MEFEDEVDINGEDNESSFIRRLYRILNMPTGDLAHNKDKLNKSKKKKNKKCFAKLKNYCKRKCGKKEVQE